VLTWYALLCRLKGRQEWTNQWGALPLQILEARTVLIDPLGIAPAGILAVAQFHLRGLEETVSCQRRFGTSYHLHKDWQLHAIKMKMVVLLPSMVDMVVVVGETAMAEVIMTMVVVAVVAPLLQ
jgi:hypothetical protein